MTHPGKARVALKRGALVAAANWEVVAIESVAETTFKLLVAVPILGGAFLVTMLLGRDLSEVLAGDLKDILFGVASTLLGQPIALSVYLAGLFLVLAGGSALQFLVKGGTISVLVQADRVAGPIEKPPLRLPGFRRAMQFTMERFIEGSAHMFRRFLALGIVLGIVYALAAALCVALAYGLYRSGGERPLILGSVLALALTLFLILVTVINVLYLLTQVVMVVDDVGVGRALSQVRAFLKGEARRVTRVFVVTVLLLVAATVLSIAATWGFYLIAYVPLAGVIVLPLQLGAWLLRNLVFQYLGLTALGAYLSLYRSFDGDPDAVVTVSSSR